VLEENIRKIQTNHQEEIKKVEGEFERKIEKIREECEEKIQSCSAPTTPTIATTTNVPHINMEEASTIKTTTVTTLHPMDTKQILPQSSKMIYLGEGWKYFKIPIPAGNFKITGPKIAEVCKQYGMETPCACRKSCYKQKQCVETAHTAIWRCIDNIFGLQQAINRKGYKARDENHLQYTFVYSSEDKDKDGVDGACGYWPTYYCHQGEETESDGVNKFALCTIQE